MMRRMSNGAFESRGTIDSKLLFGARGVVVAGNARRAFPHVRRQERQESPHLVERVLLVFRDVVDDAALRVNLHAAEFFFRAFDAERALDQRGSADQYLSGVPRHQREMRRDESSGRKPRNGAERGRGNRHLSERIGDHLEARLGKHRFTDGPAFAPASAHTAAATFE